MALPSCQGTKTPFGLVSFLSTDFNAFWLSVMSASLFTEVKWRWAIVSTGMGDRFSALLMSVMALRLALVDQTPLRSCFVKLYLLVFENSYLYLDLDKI